ncbi:MAG: hypothetical protein ACR2GA_05360 [Chloroflexota bacterium]
MKNIWKEFRTNTMYWRFRYVTRNRLRLRSWWLHNKPNSRTMRSAQQWRPRASAATPMYVQEGSVRRTWIVFLVMVACLTAIRIAGQNTSLNPTLGSIADALIIVAAIYAALLHI